MSRDGSDLLMLGFAAVAMSAKRGKGRPKSAPRKYRDIFTRDERGRIYYIDAKGTQRRATDEEIARLPQPADEKERT